MNQVIGKRHIRADGPEKVTGQGRYTADLVLTGMLHAKFLYAGVPHARIVRLDTARAAALPGVFCVLTQAHVPDVRYGPFVKDRTLFAKDVVRYEGEVVAAVAAMTEEIAARALELIEVEYEELPPVLDVEQALEPGATLVHPDWESYELEDENVVCRPNDGGYATTVKGDVEQGLAEADVVVRERYV